MDWPSLKGDLEELDDSLVSVVVVVDPLAEVDEKVLRTAFPHRVDPFKTHLIRDLAADGPLPAHHRRHIRGAAQAVAVEVCADPLVWIDDWVRLYSALVARHGLVGIRAFSPASFRGQLAVPGMVAVRAVAAGMTVSMALWLVAGRNAYYHLGASSPAGYEVSASYAVFATSLEYLRGQGVRYVDLGAAAGETVRRDGLFRFKRGWANSERPVYLCGRIVDDRRYTELSGPSTMTWFPAYRAADGDLAARPTT